MSSCSKVMNKKVGRGFLFFKISRKFRGFNFAD